MRATFIGESCDNLRTGTIGNASRHPDFFKPGLYYFVYCFQVGNTEFYVNEDDLDFSVDKQCKPLHENTFELPIEI